MSTIIILVILYLLLVKGYLWKGIVLFFGAGALYTFLLGASAESSKTAVTIFGANINAAALLTIIIVFFAIKTVKK